MANGRPRSNSTSFHRMLPQTFKTLRLSWPEFLSSGDKAGLRAMGSEKAIAGNLFVVEGHSFEELHHESTPHITRVDGYARTAPFFLDNETSRIISSPAQRWSTSASYRQSTTNWTLRRVPPSPISTTPNERHMPARLRIRVYQRESWRRPWGLPRYTSKKYSRKGEGRDPAKSSFADAWRYKWEEGGSANTSREIPRRDRQTDASFEWVYGAGRRKRPSGLVPMLWAGAFISRLSWSRRGRLWYPWNLS